MGVETLISKLNRTVVTLVYTDFEEENDAEVMTLERRLATTCEEGELISGRKLNQVLVESGDIKQNLLFRLHDDGMLMFNVNAVYCWTSEDIYWVGTDYSECVKNLNEGYISQLDNNDYDPECDDNAWFTLFGSYPQARINKDAEVVM